MQPVFDGHNDALTREDHAAIATGRSGGHLDIPRMREGGMRGGIFAVFTPSSRVRKRPVRRGPGVLEFELAPSVGQRKAAADPSLEALDTWYAAGLRSLGPVWSRPNAFAQGVPFVSPSSPDIGPGLSAAGKAPVRRCAELGIVVDTSHLNEAGFWDIARLEAGPLVASHSGAHALAASSRNLTDAQLDAIGASDGIVGIVFANAFLRNDFAADDDTPLELIADHARYVAERIGTEHVGFGSDFDGAPIPAALGDVSGLPRLLGALEDTGFSGKEIAAIAWDNWRRVLAAWW